MKKVSQKDKKLHPWRKCPAGQHWVVTHPLNMPSKLTTRHGHCCTNPSHKDQLYPDEIHKIAEEYFGRLKKLPISDQKALHNKYDRFIAGWTKYWNEVLQPKESLDPDLIKALIYTESTFNKNAKNRVGKRNWARGLMQITDDTIKILKDEKGELGDFLVNLDEKDASDPNLNICAGIRWLFNKKRLLESKLKRPVSWEEAVMEYKGYTKDLRLPHNTKEYKEAIKEQKRFLDYYRKLIK